MKQLTEEKRTMIFYESPHRILKTIDEFITYFGAERQASISRELSKLYEETVRGSLQDLKLHFESHPIKGEFVFCVAGLED